MTPKEKAFELIDKMREQQPSIFKEYGIDVEYELAVNSSLVCVEEIMKTNLLLKDEFGIESSSGLYRDSTLIQYWKSAKEELLKM